ncbi:hypothetical protein [Nocardia cyriacigeorgica]|nr:hypothetical protein [Nocardia cyriacigeorgica]TLF54999.1 hypothetical protein FEK31_22065 [Nocardia cyriacigeorgica]
MANSALLISGVPLDVPILTRRGWVMYDQILPGDETPGLNIETDRTEWTGITDINTYDNEEVVESTSMSWSVCSTPGHRWIRWNHASGTYSKVTTAGTTRGISWQASAQMAAGPGLDLTENEAELMGWLLTDGSQWEGGAICAFEGCTNPARARGLCGSHSRQLKRCQELHPLRACYPRGAVADFSLFVWQTKPAGVQRLAEVLGEHGRWNGKGYRIIDSYARDLLRRARIEHVKSAPQLLEMINEMSAVQREATLRGVINGDGTRVVGRKSEHIRIYQDDGPLVDVIAILGYFCGYRPSVLKREVEGFPGYESKGVHLKITLCRPRASPGRQPMRSLGPMRVWCPTTELGSWTARFGKNPVLTAHTDGSG